MKNNFFSMVFWKWIFPSKLYILRFHWNGLTEVIVMNFLNLYHPQATPANEKMIMPALMAQLDVHPSGDQEVAGSSRHFMEMKYFLLSFSPFCWFKKGSFILPLAIYMYKIMYILNVFWNLLRNFHQISHVAFCRKGIDNLFKWFSDIIYHKST